MKLTELHPKWITLNGWVPEDAFYRGVSFLCPRCPRNPCPTCGHDGTHRYAVMFWPPIDPAGWMARMAAALPQEGHKRVSGDTFDTLTLEPSIGFDPHWHGHIVGGEVTFS